MQKMYFTSETSYFYYKSVDSWNGKLTQLILEIRKQYTQNIVQ